MPAPHHSIFYGLDSLPVFAEFTKFTGIECLFAEEILYDDS